MVLVFHFNMSNHIIGHMRT